MGNSTNGRNLVGIISGWMVLKGVVNLIIGFSLSNILTLVVTVILVYFMITSKKYVNYITAALLIIVVLANIWNNIKGGYILYIAQAVVDVVCAVALVINKDIKEFFNEN